MFHPSSRKRRSCTLYQTDKVEIRSRSLDHGGRMIRLCIGTNLCDMPESCTAEICSGWLDHGRQRFRRSIGRDRRGKWDMTDTPMLVWDESCTVEICSRWLDHDRQSFHPSIGRDRRCIGMCPSSPSLSRNWSARTMWGIGSPSWIGNPTNWYGNRSKTGTAETRSRS